MWHMICCISIWYTFYYKKTIKWCLKRPNKYTSLSSMLFSATMWLSIFLPRRAVSSFRHEFNQDTSEPFTSDLAVIYRQKCPGNPGWWIEFRQSLQNCHMSYISFNIVVCIFCCVDCSLIAWKCNHYCHLISSNMWKHKIKNSKTFQN